VLGKPSQIALDACCKRLAVEAQDVMVIGDDLRLEPPMAKAGGAFSILVRTGLGMQASDAGSADWTIEGLGEISRLLD
jgi:ribonucleotide monophosphatase NagD (HAD superfamily)